MTIRATLSRIINTDVQAKRRNHLASVCTPCAEKDLIIEQKSLQIDELEKTIAKLRAKSSRPFSHNTPSSKEDFKANAEENNQKKSGGAKKGHKGSTRKAPDRESATEIVAGLLPENCPDCGGVVKTDSVRDRRVLDITEQKIKDLIYEVARGSCANCGKHCSSPVSALPRALIGNRLLSTIAVSHYLYGQTMGVILQQLRLKVSAGTIWGALSRLSDICEKANPNLIKDYRHELVRHADETSWRTDGKNGYTWIFTTKNTSLFLFGKSRSASVPSSIFGKDPLAGVLIVDRYNGYNQLPVRIQYCYAHLLREVKSLLQDFEGDDEIKVFSDNFGTYLSDAMRLRSLPIDDVAYYQAAEKLQELILKMCEEGGHHLGIKKIQDIFLDHTDRLFHWVENRKIPAENNFAERETRPTVIARKLSHGSQSERGANNRSHIMSLLHTCRKRLGARGDPIEWLVHSLDEIAKKPEINIYDLLPRVIT